MAIGRTFEEVIQKGLRMIGQGMHGFVENRELDIEDVEAALKAPTDKRIFCYRKGIPTRLYHRTNPQSHQD